MGQRDSDQDDKPQTIPGADPGRPEEPGKPGKPSGTPRVSRSTVYDPPPLKPRSGGTGSRHWMRDSEPPEVESSKGSGDDPVSDDEIGGTKPVSGHPGYGDRGEKDYEGREAQGESEEAGSSRDDSK